MKPMKKTIAALLCVLLLPACALADKQEVVYVIGNAAGEVTDIEVVNSFDVGSATDYGDYTKVKMLNTTGEIQLADGVVTFSANADSVYYQGTLSSFTLPWHIAITYFLDGEPCPAADLAGKSGALKICFSVSKNEECTGNFYDTYALQASFTLDGEKCAKLQAEGATIVSVGSKKQITYTILPGKGIDAALYADVTDFEMDAVQINGLRLQLNVQLDEEKITDKAAQLQTAAQGLNDGAGTVSAGASAAKESAGTLESGMNAFSTSAATLAAGLDTLQAGITSAQAGLETLNGQSAALTAGSAEVKTALLELQSALAGMPLTQEQLALSESISTLVEKYNALDAGVNAYAEGVTAFYTSCAPLSAGAASLATGGNDLANGAQTLAAGTTALATGLAALSDGASELAAGTGELASETESLGVQVQEKLDEVDALTGKAEIVSFTSDKNKDVTAVQFVIKTEAIQKPEIEAEAAEQEEILNFWQKLLKLFGI